MSSTLTLEIHTVRKRGCIVPFYERKTLAPFPNLFLALHSKRLGMDCSPLVFYFYSFLKSRRRFREHHASQHWNWPSQLLGHCPTWHVGRVLGSADKASLGLSPKPFTQDQKVLLTHSDKRHGINKMVLSLSLLWIPVHTSYQGKMTAEPRQDSKSLDMLYSSQVSTKTPKNLSNISTSLPMSIFKVASFL